MTAKPLCLYLAAGSVALLAATTCIAQINEEINARGDAYTLEGSWFRLPPGRRIGNTAGLTIDNDGVSVWVYDACGGTTCVGSLLDPILKFGPDGDLETSFGAGLIVRPHAIHVDPDGNVWVTDRLGGEAGAEGRGHQVHKLSPEGELLMSLGTAGVAGDGPNEFNAPSAVLVAPTGDIFVGDGHGPGTNARIVKLSPDGVFIKEWGGRGTAPGQFATPHSLAMDSRGRLFVADRENSRLQIFDQEGNFLDEWFQFGRPSGVYIDSNDVLYVADSESDNDNVATDWKEGIRIGDAATGRVFAFIADHDANGSQEGVAADDNGVVYTSLTRDMALRRYFPR
ncbi:MAG TPA: peptidyl-alpha-hydroxyglycine alpha-amidating lyase family protein [Gammaproteobacteria bacterium]